MNEVLHLSAASVTGRWSGWMMGVRASMWFVVRFGQCKPFWVKLMGKIMGLIKYYFFSVLNQNWDLHQTFTKELPELKHNHKKAVNILTEPCFLQNVFILVVLYNFVQIILVVVICCGH